MGSNRCVVECKGFSKAPQCRRFPQPIPSPMPWSLFRLLQRGRPSNKSPKVTWGDGARQTRCAGHRDGGGATCCGDRMNPGYQTRRKPKDPKLERLKRGAPDGSKSPKGSRTRPLQPLRKGCQTKAPVGRACRDRVRVAAVQVGLGHPSNAA